VVVEFLLNSKIKISILEVIGDIFPPYPTPKPKPIPALGTKNKLFSLVQ